MGIQRTSEDIKAWSDAIRATLKDINYADEIIEYFTKKKRFQTEEISHLANQHLLNNPETFIDKTIPHVEL